MSARLFALLFFTLAGGFMVAGLLVPAHFSQQAQSVVKQAGLGTETVTERANFLVDFSKPGPAALLARAGATNERLQARIDASLSDHPQYRISGGIAPFMQSWLEEAPRVPDGSHVAVMSLLAPAQNRADLLDFMSSSDINAVQNILATRRMTGTARFLPVGSAGGAPLEASILTTALLMQSGANLKPELAQRLAGLARQVQYDDNQAIAQLENWYLAVLGAGRQCNWLQLSTWVSMCDTAQDFERTVSLARRFPEKFPQLYAAILLSGNPSAVADYLNEHSMDKGWQDLQFALEQGKGSLGLLLQTQEAIYEPPQWLAWTTELAPDFLPKWALQMPALALTLRLVLFSLAGMFFAIGLSRICKRELRGEVQLWHPLDLVRHLVLASIALVILVFSSEPSLLAAQASAPANLNFNVFLAQSDASKPTDAMLQQLDKITLLVLLLFLAVQMVIYLIGLIRIARIKRQQMPSTLKIKLLENEEPLFDSGLYVGLGGTVASLIMLAMGLVEASLIAAYASTLFGIIFVAILKIFHVRPYRRTLLIEADKWGR